MTILPDAPPRAPKRQLNTRLVAAVAAGVLAAGGGAAYAMGVFGGSGSSTESLSGLTGEQILARVHAAELQAGAVHLVATTTVSGKQMRIDAYAGSASGVQTITFGPARAEARVIGQTAYFTGNSAAIHELLGMSATSVPPKNTWYRLSPSDPRYKDVSDGVTLSSLLDGMALTGPYTVLPASPHNGVMAVGVRGTDKDDSVPATLWVAASGPTLPVEYDTTMGTIALTASFTDWGKAVTVAKPNLVRKAPAAHGASGLQADAQMKTNLRDLAVAEETYLTDAAAYATARQLKHSDISFVTLRAGQSVTVHISGNRTDGFCLAGRVGPGRYFLYSSLEGGMSEAVRSDTCSPSLYPRNGGALRAN